MIYFQLKKLFSTTVNRVRREKLWRKDRIKILGNLVRKKVWLARVVSVSGLEPSSGSHL